MPPFVIWVVKNVMPVVAWLISLFIPGRSARLALLEANNKAEIMGLVNHAESVFPPPGVYRPLPELVEQCYAMGDFPALWAVEGLGNYYAETFRERKLVARNLLTDPEVASIPDKSLTMLHAGIGLSFAKRSLEGLKPKSPAAEIRQALEKFIGLCRGSSRPGYAGCALESLGLVTLILHSPEMARLLDKHLTEIDPKVATYMWRGAGRALYFHPKNFIPGWSTPWRGIEMCKQLAPHEMARRNMRAGIAWAITVVNMKRPEIMESMLLHQGEQFADRDMFINGVISSIIMRYDITPEDAYLRKFIQYRPDPSSPLLCRLWKHDIRNPCEAALNEIYPVLKRHKCLEQIFHYQSLPDLAVRLESTRTSGPRA